MNINCVACGSTNVKTVPPGVSRKTGKPYGEFHVCEDCKKTWNPNPAPKRVGTGRIPEAPVRELEDFDQIMTAIGELKILIKKVAKYQGMPEEML